MVQGLYLQPKGISDDLKGMLEDIETVAEHATPQIYQNTFSAVCVKAF